MRYLLDTNTCIVYVKQVESNVRKHLESLLPQEIVICSVVKAELLYGAMKSIKVQENLAKRHNFWSKFLSLPFDDKAAEIYGNIRADLERKGTPIGSYDLQIAAIALANNLILVTHNTRELALSYLV